MIDATIALPAGWEDADPDALLAQLLADGYDSLLACCDRCGAIVDAEDAGESEATGETICIACFIAAEARHSVEAIDAAEASHAAARERALAELPAPDTDDVPF